MEFKLHQRHIQISYSEEALEQLAQHSLTFEKIEKMLADSANELEQFLRDERFDEPLLLVNQYSILMTITYDCLTIEKLLFD